jgi:hypothetical protein
MSKLDEESDAYMKARAELYKALVEAVKARDDAYRAWKAAQVRAKNAYTFWSTFRI